MREYEYSFKVKQIKSIIDFCEKNGFTFISKTKQNRIVFENRDNDNIISRITTTWEDDKRVTVWDFKCVNNINLKLKDSNESEEMVLTDDGVKIAKSMLEVGNFECSANNLRTRYVYEKDDVKFEIDDYEVPEMKVVAVEGNKEKVDKICEKLQREKIIE